MQDGDSPRTLLRLSLQRALLGAIPSSLRAVTCETAATEIRLRFVFDGKIGEDDAEDARIVGSEVISDFPAQWTINDEIVRLDYPEKLGEVALADWVYRRKESEPK